MKTIGIYGGTFDPIHLGHLHAARTAMAALELDELLLVPAGIPPHKALPANVPAAEHRLAMVRLAADGIGARASDIELRREGKSYTLDTLRAIHEREPEARLWLLMGTDMFLTFQNWREPGEILRLAGLCAFGRSADDGEALFAPQRDCLTRQFPWAQIVTLVLPDLVDISSTQLRAMLAQGEGQRYLAPAVYGYILREGLYGTRADVRHLSLEQLRPVALSYLRAKRVPHVLGTEEEAARLAGRWGADVDLARRAALLHDCTKRLSPTDHRAIAERYHALPLPAEDKLYHAITGAILAREVFGEQEEVVSAIRWHTTGRADMSLLEKIIYLADYIEPTRDFPGLEALRRLAYEDLDRALLTGLEMSLENLRERGIVPDRDSVCARDHLKGKLP